MKALNKHLNNVKTLCFLDLEGTQFSHEIIAIGAVKVNVNSNGKVNRISHPKKFKCYVKCLGQIGRFVQNMCNIDETLLKEQGLTLEEAFNKFKAFVKVPLESCSYIVFGSNDTKMILDSINYSKPSNENIGFTIVKNHIDYLQFISQYIKDEKGNNYSLVNYLKVFGIEPYGVSHDPLNDAYDLMNLYKAVDKKKDIVLKEYLKVLQKQKVFPAPVKKIIASLIAGEDVKSSRFIDECKAFLE